MKILIKNETFYLLHRKVTFLDSRKCPLKFTHVKIMQFITPKLKVKNCTPYASYMLLIFNPPLVAVNTVVFLLG